MTGSSRTLGMRLVRCLPGTCFFTVIDIFPTVIQLPKVQALIVSGCKRANLGTWAKENRKRTWPRTKSNHSRRDDDAVTEAWC